MVEVEQYILIEVIRIFLIVLSEYIYHHMISIVFREGGFTVNVLRIQIGATDARLNLSFALTIMHIFETQHALQGLVNYCDIIEYVSAVISLLKRYPRQVLLSHIHC